MSDLAALLKDAWQAWVDDEQRPDDFNEYAAARLVAAGLTLAPQPDPASRELREVVKLTADWLDAIIAESDPKPSELQAMVLGLRAVLARPTLPALTVERLAEALRATSGIPARYRGPLEAWAPTAAAILAALAEEPGR